MKQDMLTAQGLAPLGGQQGHGARWSGLGAWSMLVLSYLIADLLGDG